MREQDHLAALGGNLGDGGSDAFEAGGVGDAAVVGGNVEVDAEQHAFALHVDVIEGAEWFCHWRSLVPGALRREVPPRRTGTYADDRSRLSDAPLTRCIASGTRSVTYSSFPIATAVSAMRLEKPHSLSYQDITRTKLPFCTLVWSMWNVEECGSWLKSIETFGAVV